MEMFMQKSKSFLNFIYFHRRRLMVASAFTGTYSFVCYRGLYSESESYRMAVAGSLANISIEAGFHFVDTVNVRTKISDSNNSTMHMVKHIYRNEGMLGFTKGFSAMFYGSIACGFIYFALYKSFKALFRDFLGEDVNIGWTYFLSAMVAEFFTLMVYYPYDLMKCRLQSMNYKFKYKNLPHAFRKEIT